MAKFYWASWNVLSKHGNHYAETVMEDEHPFETAKNWGKPVLRGIPALLNFKGITKEEFNMHRENAE